MRQKIDRVVKKVKFFRDPHPTPDDLEALSAKSERMANAIEKELLRCKREGHEEHLRRCMEIQREMSMLLKSRGTMARLYSERIAKSCRGF